MQNVNMQNIEHDNKKQLCALCCADAIPKPPIQKTLQQHQEPGNVPNEIPTPGSTPEAPPNTEPVPVKEPPEHPNPGKVPTEVPPLSHPEKMMLLKALSIESIARRWG